MAARRPSKGWGKQCEDLEISSQSANKTASPWIILGFPPCFRQVFTTNMINMGSTCQAFHLPSASVTLAQAPCKATDSGRRSSSCGCWKLEIDGCFCCFSLAFLVTSLHPYLYNTQKGGGLAEHLRTIAGDMLLLVIIGSSDTLPTTLADARFALVAPTDSLAFSIHLGMCPECFLCVAMKTRGWQHL